MFPFLPKRERPSGPTLVALATLALLYGLYEWQTGGRGRVAHFGDVERLAAARVAPDAYARAGDLVLTAPRGASLTMVAAPDLPGHRQPAYRSRKT